MDIRAYQTRNLPYHFVLFYNLSSADLIKYSLDLEANADDNALLTYCYIDRMAGLSYEVICKASIDGNGNVVYRDPSKTAMMRIREGGIISDAYVYPEGGKLARFQDRADIIKENYGYHMDMIKAIEEKSFPDRRHVCYPDDVMVILYGMGMKPEQIWTRDVDKLQYSAEIEKLVGTKIIHTTPNGIEELIFVGAGRLLNEPYNTNYGYHNGDIVPIYSLKGPDGTELPVVLAKGMQLN